MIKIFKFFNSMYFVQPCFKTHYSKYYHYKKPLADSGIRNRKRIFRDDPSFSQELESEEDFENLETDFENADYGLNANKREQRQRKNRLQYNMTKSKFFTSVKAPNMLTWGERRQIIELHKKDPSTWTIDALADSFPATREIITKILKRDWIPENMKKIKTMDAKVLENWKLLAEGKLEVDEELGEHLKKFLERREAYLETLKTEDFEKLLPPEKPKQVWNNGQMSHVLESYQRSLKLLESKKSAKEIESTDQREEITNDYKINRLRRDNRTLEFNGNKRQINNENVDQDATEKEIIAAEKGKVRKTYGSSQIEKVEERPMKISFSQQRDTSEIKNYSSDKDREVFEAEETSIRGSSFWPDSELTVSKDALPTPRDSFKMEEYPERIRIPKDKRGKGLTYQVNDCFYDDDGEFLYRVPGMRAKVDKQS